MGDALRQLRRHPGFTAVVVIALALGIGANTAVFSVFDAVLLKPLPVPKPDELVLFEWTFKANPKIAYLTGEWTHDAGSNEVRAASFSRPAYEAFQSTTALERVFACDRLGALHVVIDGRAERVEAQAVSGTYFAGLGLTPALGRTVAEDDTEAAVISHGYWQRRFGGQPNVLGTTGTVDGHAFTIVGVAPRGFAGTLHIGTPPDVFLPLALQARLRAGAAGDPNSHSLQVMGRIGPDVPRARAEAEMSARLAESLPDADLYQPRLRLAPGHQGLTRYREALREPLLMVGAVTGLVLLMACASVAGLHLARASSRQHEIAVRRALGATRWSLVRQMLTESALLSSLGGAAGLLVAIWTKELLAAGVMTVGVPAITLDARVLGFAAGLSTITGLLSGSLAAFRATGGDVGLRPSPRHFVTGRALVVAQVSVSFVLLVGAGLLVRTLANLREVDVGFDGRTVHVFKVQASGEDTRASDLHARVLDHVRAEPALGVVGTSHHDLVAGNADRTPVAIEGTPSAGEAPRYAFTTRVGGDFFGATGIPIHLGRPPGSGDVGRDVMVVNESFVRAYLPNRNPLGTKVNGSRIIGVAGDTKREGLREPSPPTMFVPGAPSRDSLFYVRVDRPASEVAALVRHAIRGVSPTLVAYGFNTADGQVEDTVRRERFLATLTTLFGTLALVLAAVGLYGLVAYNVRRRTREIGVRMALGASAGHIRRHTIVGGLRLVLAGSVVGVLGALALGRVLASVLYGVSAADPATFVASWLALTAAAALACWLPAHRAAGVDPAQALRYE